MINLTISKALKEKCESIFLGCVYCDVKVSQKNNSIWQEISRTQQFILDNLIKADVKNIPAIKASRDCYKNLGWNPDRYPLSSEALIKRILSQKGMYQINNIVDINNLISLRSYFSIGSYDADKIDKEIVFDIGKQDETYESMGKGNLSVSGLPVFRDSRGAFGSPTSDSKRSCITLNTKSILMLIISFSGSANVTEAARNAVDLLIEFAEATNIYEGIVT
jgi:DNA/RNA-binding domain of Phe-tRNA-synthetase-like protein